MTNDAAALLLSMMHKALENPRHLTRTPISFGARMRLLSLAHSLVVSSHEQLYVNVLDGYHIGVCIFLQAFLFIEECQVMAFTSFRAASGAFHVCVNCE